MKIAIYELIGMSGSSWHAVLRRESQLLYAIARDVTERKVAATKMARARR